MEDLIGRGCKAKAGHDKDEYFIIVSFEENFVYLSDGKSRSLENPKKKKIKHVELLDFKSEDVKSKLINSEKITNSDIREVIEELKEKINAKGD